MVNGDPRIPTPLDSAECSEFSAAQSRQRDVTGTAHPSTTTTTTIRSSSSSSKLVASLYVAASSATPRHQQTATLKTCCRLKIYRRLRRRTPDAGTARRHQNGRAASRGLPRGRTTSDSAAGRTPPPCHAVPCRVCRHKSSLIAADRSVGRSLYRPLSFSHPLINAVDLRAHAFGNDIDTVLYMYIQYTCTPAPHNDHGQMRLFRRLLLEVNSTDKYRS